MSYGLPAIAVGGGGASAAIVDGENGFIVKNDPQEFSQTALRVLHQDALQARLSEQALRSVRSQGLPQMCQDVVQVYRQVINAQPENAENGNFAWI